jgi:hypothetical protein
VAPAFELVQGITMTLNEAFEQLCAVPEFEKVRIHEDTVGFRYRGRGYSVTASALRRRDSMEAYIDYVQVSSIPGCEREQRMAGDGSPIADPIAFGATNKK